MDRLLRSPKNWPVRLTKNVLECIRNSVKDIKGSVEYKYRVNRKGRQKRLIEMITTHITDDECESNAVVSNLHMLKKNEQWETKVRQILKSELIDVRDAAIVMAVYCTRMLAKEKRAEAKEMAEATVNIITTT